MDEEEEKAAIILMDCSSDEEALLRDVARLPVFKSLLDPHNSYRDLKQPKAWEELQKEYPTTEDWMATFRFSLS